VGDLDAKVKDAEVKFKAGEMTFDEFRAVERNAEGERRKLDAAQLKSEISSESGEQAAAARWKFETDRFFKDTAKGDGIDYKAKGNEPLWAALDAEVKRLAKDDANADKSGPWFLEQAHAAVKKLFGRSAAPAGDGGKSDAEKKAAAEAAAVAARKAAKKAPVQSLSGLPDAGTDAPGDKGEFGHLEGLEGMELEAALAALPKDEADRYLSGR
jgi:hypothetical protein